MFDEILKRNDKGASNKRKIFSSCSRRETIIDVQNNCILVAADTHIHTYHIC